MPQAVRFHKIGGPESLVLEELPSRQPGDGEAKIRAEAVGLNRAESMYFRGIHANNAANARAVTIGVPLWCSSASNPLLSPVTR